MNTDTSALAPTALLGPKDHPLRRPLSEEMHVRILPSMKSPERLCQLLVLSGEKGAESDFRHASALCTRFGATTPPAGVKHFSANLGTLRFHWERHTEFSTYTFIAHGKFEHPFNDPVLAGIPQGWLASVPGMVLRATQLTILAPDMPEPDDRELTAIFKADDLVSCLVEDGKARIWTDFRLHSNGFGHLLMHDKSISGTDMPRLVQRLLEMGNYRKMALLALPMAQELTPTVSDLERKVTDITTRMANGKEKEEALIAELSDLSASLARIASETSYRISATKAYEQLVQDRLEELREQRISGFQTLSDFTERRLVPAVRTCNSFSRRLQDLANRAGRASNLLRTRLSISLEKQNADLLSSMNERTRQQFRLQQTVEGLSIAAISYYLVGLAGYALKAIHAGGIPINVTILQGLSIIPVISLVWFIIHRVRKKIIR